MRIDLGVDRPVELCDAPTGKGGTWNRDGTILFTPRFNSGIHRVSREGGESTPVTVLNDSENDDSHRFPFFLPDGRHFLYMIQFTSGEERPAVMIGSLDGTIRLRITAADSQAIYSSGHLIYLIDDTLIARPFDPAGLELAGEAFQVAEGVAQLPGTGRGVFSTSDQGVLVYRPALEETTMELLWVDRRGERLRSLGEMASPFNSLALSPDESRVAVAVQDAAGQAPDIWLYHAETGQKTRFTFGADVTSLLGSPGGESLVFMASIEGSLDLYRKSLRGSDITPLGVPLGLPMSWSPDGQFIMVMAAGEDTGADLWILPMSGDRERYPYLATSSLEASAQFSPDGRWIAYAANATDVFEIYVGSFQEPDRRWQISTRGGQSPRWRGDGKELYYVGPGRVLMAAQIETEGSVVSVVSSEKLFELEGYSQSLWQGFGNSSDGKRFLIQRLASGEDPSTGSLILVSDWRAGIAD